MNQRRAGIILNYFSKIIQIATGLFYTPIMLQTLGQSEYGTYQLASSVISYLSLLSLGMTGAYNRFYYRYKTKDDEKGIAKLNGLFLAVFIFVAFICIICGGCIYQNIGLILGDKLLEDEIQLAKHLMFYLIFNMAISFPMYVFDCNIIAKEEFIFQKVLIVLQGLLGPFITLPLLFLGYGSVGVVFVTTFLTVVKFIVSIFYCIKKLHMKFSIGKFEWKLIAEILHFSLFIVIGHIVEVINWSVDNYLLGRYMGAIPVAIYGVGSQINNLYMQLSTAVSGVFTPQVNRIVAQNDDNTKLDDLFIKVGRIQFILLLLVLIEFSLWGKEFIILWAGKEYVKSYLIALILILPITVPLIQNIGIEIQYAKNMHKVRAFVYLAVAVANIFISIFLIKIMGETGAALGTAISLLLGNILFMNYYYDKKIGLDIKRFWLSILKFTPTAAVTLLLGCIIRWIHPITTWLDFCINAGIIFVIYVVIVYVLSLNSYEKGLLKKLLKKA